MMGNMIKGCEYLGFKLRACLCNSVLGQLLNNTLKPVGAISGGLVPPLCPPNAVNPADLAKPADSAEGAAARIKADEADAKARRAAIRYLGTVDCHYWPEAIDALINGLRADRNECVRLEAALALGKGCCCNPKTITALGITVAGTDEDGNPAETSERVRAAAFMALTCCVDRFPPAPEAGPAPEPVPEPVPAPKPEPVPGATAAGQKRPGEAEGAKPADKPKVVPAVFYQRVASLPMPQVVAKARRQLRGNATVSAPVGAAHAASSANQGLLGMAFSAMNEPTPLPVVEGQAAPGAPAAPTSPPAEVPGGTKHPAAPVTPAPAPSPGISVYPPALTPLPPGQPLPIIPPATATPATNPVPSSRSAAKPAPVSGPVTPLIPPATVAPAPSPVAPPRPATAPAPVSVPVAPPLSVRPPVSTGTLSLGQATSPPVSGPVVPPPPPVILTAPAPARPQQTPPLPPAARPQQTPTLPPLPSPPSLPPVTSQPVVPAVLLGNPSTSAVVPARAQTPPLPANPTPAPAPVFRPAVPVVKPREDAGTDDQAARWVAVLRDAPDAEARDWAAARLQSVNWRTHPEVVQALVTGALKDPTPAVRTSCIRALNRLDAGTTHVLATLDTLLADRDPAVKQAAEEALRGLLTRRRHQ
jgi:hypothetical protein